MQVSTVFQILYLAFVAGLSAFAFVRLHKRIPIKYLVSTLLFLIFGIIFISEVSLAVYTGGALLIICSTIFLLASNVVVKEREYFRQLEKRQTEHDSSTGLPKYPIFLERTKRALSKHSLDSPYYPAVMVILISGLRQLDRRVPG